MRWFAERYTRRFVEYCCTPPRYASQEMSIGSRVQIDAGCCLQGAAVGAPGVETHAVFATAAVLRGAPTEHDKRPEAEHLLERRENAA